MAAKEDMVYELLIVNVKTHKVIPILSSVQAAEEMAGLKSGELDFGVVQEGVGIIVYEYGLFDHDTRWFALGGRLYAGNAVLFGFNHEGETIDLGIKFEPLWLDTMEDVEAAIAAGKVIRPFMAVNEAVLWQWPQEQKGQTAKEDV